MPWMLFCKTFEIEKKKQAIGLKLGNDKLQCNFGIKSYACKIIISNAHEVMLTYFVNCTKAVRLKSGAIVKGNVQILLLINIVTRLLRFAGYVNIRDKT